MVDIIPETINRIRLSDNDLLLLQRVLNKVDKKKLVNGEIDFHTILSSRVEGRIKLKEKI